MNTERNQNVFTIYNKKSIFKNSLRDTIKDHILTNSIWYSTFLLLLVKALLFVGFIQSTTATVLNLYIVFYGNLHIIVFICFTISIIASAYLFKGRNQFRFLIFINVIVSVIIIGDLWNFRAFGTFLSLHLIKQTSNLDNLGDSILSMFRYMDIIFLIDIIILVAIGFTKKHLYRENRRNVKLAAALMVISISYISIIHYKVDIKENGAYENLLKICWTPNDTMTNLAPVGYHLFDSYMYFKERLPYKLTEDENNEIKAWYANKQENLEDNKYRGIFEGKNLLLLQVESLENFVINQKINGQEITPNINKLLSNSIYFTNFHEQVYNGTSSDSDLLANTSVYPIRRGSTFFRYPDNTYNSLPKLLENKGYNTLAIHPDKGSYWNWMPALTSIGFDKTIDSTQLVLDEHIGLGLSDESFFRQIAPKIKELKQPFYTFMVTLTSHGPFDLPSKYRELKLDEAFDKTYMGGYLQSLHYTDKHIGNFLSKLESDGLLDNTVVVLYGDHTGVHKFYSEEVSNIEPSEDWWKDNNMRMPFIIYSKGYTGEVIDTRGGQIDLLPTVAYAMGIDENEFIQTAMGRNLFNTNKSFAVLADKTLLGGENMTEEEKQAAIKGVDIADIIIQSNYFK